MYPTILIIVKIILILMSSFSYTNLVAYRVTLPRLPANDGDMSCEVVLLQRAVDYDGLVDNGVWGIAGCSCKNLAWNRVRMTHVCSVR